jgi:hypothetical protein
LNNITDVIAKLPITCQFPQVYFVIKMLNTDTVAITDHHQRSDADIDQRKRVSDLRYKPISEAENWSGWFYLTGIFLSVSSRKSQNF